MVTSCHVTKVAITPAIAENPILHANLIALYFVEPDLLTIEVLHYGNRDFPPFLLL